MTGILVTPIGLGLLSMAIQSNQHIQIHAFLALCGVGIGMTFSPIALQARYSQTEEQVAAAAALTLFVRLCSLIILQNLKGCCAVVQYRQHYRSGAVFYNHECRSEATCLSSHRERIDPRLPSQECDDATASSLWLLEFEH